MIAADPLPALAAAGIAPAARAEELPPETWPALLRALAPFRQPQPDSSGG